jgi:XTP/dITP diphosphohydrolase
MGESQSDDGHIAGSALPGRAAPNARQASQPDTARLLLATRNEHKRREFARLLPGMSVDALPNEVRLPSEDGATFEDNALGKARAAARATGRVSIADDSGIEAAALGGAPGVRSARFAGEDASDEQNLAKLLAEAPAGSPLAYVCALAYVDPVAGSEHVFEGRCTGRLADRPRGEGGFGYDPAFLPDEESGALTMAQLSDARKDAISHRGRAVRALHEWLGTD